MGPDGMQPQALRELKLLQGLSWKAIREGHEDWKKANVTPFFKKKLQIGWSSVCCYLVFSQIFDTGCSNILPGKSKVYRLDNRSELDWKLPEMLGWKDCDQPHKVHLEATHQRCTPEIDIGVFNIFISYLGSGTECSLSKLTDDGKLEWMAAIPNVWDSRNILTGISWSSKKGNAKSKEPIELQAPTKAVGPTSWDEALIQRTFWASLGRKLPAGQGRWSCSSTQCCWVHTWSAGSCSGLSKTREMLSYWRESSAGPRKWLRNWSVSPNRKSWDSELIGDWVTEPWDKKAQGDLINVNKYLEEVIEKDGIRIFSVVPNERTRANGANETQEIPLKHKKNNNFCESG